MAVGRFAVSCAGMFLLAATALAQGLPSAAIQQLLQPGARIIETEDLSSVAGKPRELVLWMRNPKRVVRHPDAGYCGDAVDGDHWYGPTRLSLVSSDPVKLVNTVRIISRGPTGDFTEDTFSLPFFVPNFYYHVPHINAEHEGKPKLLYLRDLTGEDGAADFVLYIYDACGIASTSVFGYNRRSDRAVQYLVEVRQTGQKTHREAWVEQIFAHEPTRPGHWEFTWEPGHGGDVWIDERVSFDKARQLFVDNETVRPYPK